MNNKSQEILYIFLVLFLSFAISILICYVLKFEPDEMSVQNLAQILAEILSVIIVLPQVIIQLTARPHRRDLSSVFSGRILFYYAIFIFSIALLGFDFFGDYHNSSHWMRTLIAFTFMWPLLLIFPYLSFLVKNYSTSENIFKLQRKKVLKKINKVALTGSQNAEEEVIVLIKELKESIVIHGAEDQHFYSLGIETLSTIFQEAYSHHGANIDNLLIEILEISAFTGLEIEKDSYKVLINEKLTQTAELVIDRAKTHKSAVNGIGGQILSDEVFELDHRTNKFVTKIILLMEKITIQGTMPASQETVRNVISMIHHLTMKALRRESVLFLEYHLVAESLLRIGLYSQRKSYKKCVSDTIANLHYLAELSVIKLPVKFSPVYRVCDVLTEIGTATSRRKNEILSIQCANDIISILTDLKVRRVEIDMRICMASFLELMANVWTNFRELEEWIMGRLDELKKIHRINYKTYIKTTREILALKNLISKSNFNAFIESIGKKKSR